MVILIFCVFQALIVVVILGWLFVPIYIKAGVNRIHAEKENSHPLVYCVYSEGSHKDNPIIKTNISWWVCSGGHHA